MLSYFYSLSILKVQLSWEALSFTILSLLCFFKWYLWLVSGLWGCFLVPYKCSSPHSVLNGLLGGDNYIELFQRILLKISLVLMGGFDVVYFVVTSLPRLKIHGPPVYSHCNSGKAHGRERSLSFMIRTDTTLGRRTWIRPSIPYLGWNHAVQTLPTAPCP